MVVAESHIQCQNEVLPTLSTISPGNKTLYLCPWNKKRLLIHYQYVKNLDKCAIVPEKSLYLLNGSWKRLPRHDPGLSKLVVEIGQDPGFPNDRLFLKVGEFNLTNIILPIYNRIERFPIQCRKTKTKVITLTNRNRCKQHNEPIRIRSKYV